jgi:small subunit ribosomal protein S16
VIEEIGRYVPTNNPSIIEVNSERAQYWLGVGAQPTEQVAVLLKLTGDYQASKGDKTAKNTVKLSEPKAEFVIDSKKKTVLVPKEQVAAKKAATVSEDAPAEAEASTPAEDVISEAADAADEAVASVEDAVAEVADETPEAPAAEEAAVVEEAPAASEEA